MELVVHRQHTAANILRTGTPEMTHHAKTLAVLASFVLMTASTGCARHVVRGSDHGVVAIPASTNGWPFRYRDKAKELMQEHFPNGYVVEHEEETVIGQTVHVNTEHTEGVVQVCGPVDVHTGTEASTVTTSDNTEWRIYYRRK